ncbi:hypothetical protein CR513_06323, partial [Mucuna pruriens]
MERKGKKYAERVNRGRKGRVFTKGDLEMFHTLRKFKLLLRGDGPFPILKRINENSYVQDMPQEYGGSMDDPNFRENSFQEGKSDRTRETKRNKGKTLSIMQEALQGPLTQSRFKRIKVDSHKNTDLLKGHEASKSSLSFFMYREYPHIA